MRNPKRFTLLAAALVTVTLLSMRGIGQEDTSAETTDEAAAEPAIGALTPLRGVDVAVRARDEAEFSEKTARVPIEAFRDEDFGTLTYISGQGSIATIPQPSVFELRYLPLDRSYEAIRFSPIAGVAWRLNTDPRVNAWQLIEEPEPVVPGSYEIDMFQISEAGMVVMRIDELTGRSWTLTSETGKADRWSAIGEPEPPASETGESAGE